MIKTPYKSIKINRKPTGNNNNIPSQIKFLNQSLSKSRIPPKIKKRITVFLRNFSSSTVNCYKVKEMSFQGLGFYSDKLPGFRPLIWMFLLGYLDQDVSKWDDILEGKRSLYWMYTEEFLKNKNELDVEKMKLDYQKWLVNGENESYEPSLWNNFVEDLELWDMIEKDVERSNRDMKFLNTPAKNYIPFKNPINFSIIQKKNIEETETPEEFPFRHKEILKRILFVFAKSNKAIGYTQGMHCIAAVLYNCFSSNNFQMDQIHAEEDTYWCMLNLITPYKDHYIKSQTGGGPHPLARILDYFDVVCGKCIPGVIEHLNKQSVDAELYSYPWFLIFFAQSFGMNELMRIWDSFFCFHDFSETRYSSTFLVYFAVSILNMSKQEILESDMAEICQKLKKLDINVEKCLKLANDIYRKFHPNRDFFTIMRKM